MPRQCRSIRRAMRRGHPLHPGSNTYMSKKESRIMKEVYEAALRKQAKEAQSTQTEESNEHETN